MLFAKNDKNTKMGHSYILKGLFLFNSIIPLYIGELLTPSLPKYLPTALDRLYLQHRHPTIHRWSELKEHLSWIYYVLVNTNYFKNIFSKIRILHFSFKYNTLILTCIKILFWINNFSTLQYLSGSTSVSSTISKYFNSSIYKLTL